MIAEYKTKTNVGVGLGFILQLLPKLLPQLAPVETPLLLGGVALFIYGCTCYARGKGHSWAWGFLGLFSLLGLIVLALMPDKAKSGILQTEEPQPPEPPAPPPPGAQ